MFRSAELQAPRPCTLPQSLQGPTPMIGEVVAGAREAPLSRGLREEL